MLYDWGVHLLDQILWMMPGAKITSVYADIRNVINEEVDLSLIHIYMPIGEQAFMPWDSSQCKILTVES